MAIKKNHFLFKQALTAVMIVVVMVSCSGIFPTKISDIYANTQRYQDKTIKVRGTVETSISLFGISGFTINDGTGTLLITGHSKSPSPKSEITVKGVLKSPVRLQDMTVLILHVTQK